MIIRKYGQSPRLPGATEANRGGHRMTQQNLWRSSEECFLVFRPAVGGGVFSSNTFSSNAFSSKAFRSILTQSNLIGLDKKLWMTSRSTSCGCFADRGRRIFIGLTVASAQEYFLPQNIFFRIIIRPPAATTRRHPLQQPKKKICQRSIQRNNKKNKKKLFLLWTFDTNS